MSSEERASPDLAPFVGWLIFATMAGALLCKELENAALSSIQEFSVTPRESLFLACFVAPIFVLSGGAALWRWRLVSRQLSAEEEEVPATTSPSRAARLRRAVDHLPSPVPEGSSGWTSPRESVVWRSRARDVDVFVWVSADESYEPFYVALAHAESGAPVDEACASAILDRFPGVSGFMEVDEPPPRLAAQHPGLRSWVSVSRERAIVAAVDAVTEARQKRQMN